MRSIEGIYEERSDPRLDNRRIGDPGNYYILPQSLHRFRPNRHLDLWRGSSRPSSRSSESRATRENLPPLIGNLLTQNIEDTEDFKVVEVNNIGADELKKENGGRICG